jgi:translocation and assembly module TamA
MRRDDRPDLDPKPSRARRSGALAPGVRLADAVRLMLAALLLGLAVAAQGAGLPLARFETAPGTPEALGPLLERVLASVERDAAGETVDAEEDERLLRRLRAAATDVLATEGYFSPRIDTGPDPASQARHLVRVDPGQRAHVAAVELDFSGAIEHDTARLAQLRAGWAFGVGMPFRDQDWSSAKTKLLNQVREVDFAAARIADSEAEVDAAAATVRLKVQIDSGPLFTLGPLVVKGLKRYPPQLVERYNPFKPGDRYDASRLLEFQRLLQQSQFFGSVIVDVDSEGPSTNAPIKVELTEAKTQRAAVGIGLSTDTGPRIEATYRHALLFGRPYTLSTGASDDRTRTVAFADILLPRRPDGYMDSMGVLREKTNIEDVLTDRWAAGVKRTRSRQSGSVSYDTLLGITLESETRSLADGSQPPETNDVLATTYTWTRRAVDQVTNPTKGDLLTLSSTLGLQRGALGELLHQSFVRIYGRYVRWVPLSPRDQLIVRGEAGHVQVQDPSYVPNDYLFRTGGTNSVRGYAYQSLGVRVGTATTGSKELLVGSAEYVRWIDQTWGAAVFCDVGDAADDLREVRLARGYGLGGRYRTVAGPLALDVAYGERDRQWRVHFAIAIAF